MKPKKSLRSFLLSFGSALLAFSTANAASLTWDNGATTGNWNNTDLNWTGAAWDNDAPDDAVFGADGVGTVTLTEAITAGSITFDTAGYTIDSSTFGLTLNTGITANQTAIIQSGVDGSIILGADNDWSVAASQILTVSSPISGATFGITKSGAGRLNLDGANTYGGDTTLSAGTLAISNATSLGAGDVLVTGTSNLTVTGGITYANAIDVGATLTLQLPSATATTAEFSGVLSGSANINIANSGSGNNQTNRIFSNTGNTFTGSVIGAAGNAVGADYFRFNSIGDGGTFTFNKGGHRGGVTYAGSSDIEFDVRQIAIGTSFTGILNGNGIPQNAFQNIGTGTVTFNSDLSVGAITGNGTFFFDGTNTGSNTFAGNIDNAISGGNLGIGKWGTGKWILSGSNSFLGNVILGNGTLSATTVDVAANNQSLGKGTLIQLGDRATSGILEFTATTNSTTDKQFQLGTTIANGGHTGAGSILNNGSASLTFTNDTFNTAITNAAAATRILTLGGTYGGGNEIQGTIQNNTGAVGVTVSGSVWSLSGTNTYTGLTSVSAGKLFVNGDSSLASGAVSVSANATLGGTGTMGGSTTIAADGKLEFNLSTAPGSHDKLDLAADKTLTFSGESTLTITSSGSPGTGLYTLVTAPGGITWTTPPTVVLPSGWAYDTLTGDGETDLVINITSTGGGGSLYEDWAMGSAFTDDDNSDGVDNGLAWILGADSPADSALDKLPTITVSGAFLNLSFTRENPYAPAKLYVEYGNDLVGWTKLELPADSGTIGGDIEVEVTAGPPDSVLVKIPTTHAGGGGKLFARLSATEN